MSNATPTALPWHRREDTRAIAAALAMVVAATAAFLPGGAHFVPSTALAFPTWSGGAKIAGALRANPDAPDRVVLDHVRKRGVM